MIIECLIYVVFLRYLFFYVLITRSQDFESKFDRSRFVKKCTKDRKNENLHVFGCTLMYYKKKNLKVLGCLEQIIFNAGE